ncbi:hypothetical protein O9929_22010 [Vibrio lentus]|nr:hypothetical protein [Vibrio lentus]
MNISENEVLEQKRSNNQKVRKTSQKGLRQKDRNWHIHGNVEGFVRNQNESAGQISQAALEKFPA